MKTFTCLVIAFSVIVLVSCSGPVTWNDCTGNNSSIMKIEKMNIIPPSNVYHGEGFAVNATFLLNEVLTGGKVQVDIQYGVLPYFSATYDLCDKFKEAKLDCPLSKGIKHGLFEGRVPFARGLLVFTINATSTEGKRVSCFTLTMNDNI